MPRPRNPPPRCAPSTPLGSSGLPGATVLRRVGPRLGLLTVRDLLFHLPRRYEDLRDLSTAAQLRSMDDGTVATARLEVVSLRVEQSFRRRVQRTVAVLRDDTGEVQATWFGRRFIERRLQGGRVGRGERPHQAPRLAALDREPGVPARRRLGDAARRPHRAGLPPDGGLTPRTLRAAIRAGLDRFGPYQEYLPAEVRGSLPAIGVAVEAAHYPENFEERDRALERLAFDELLALQVGMVSRQRQRGRTRGEPIATDEARVREAVASVESVIDAAIRRRRAAESDAASGPDVDAPIHLTDDQRAALADIRRDLGSDRPMMRLLQGDVGSGKTAVAALAMAFVADAGRQAALLAPTDLLARQHAATLRSLLEPLGHDVTLLTGSMPAADRRRALESLEAPIDLTTGGLSEGRVVVGTHALVQEAVTFADLRLAVVDEQHRFGVAEREALAAKGTAPHVLLMTATPIPRTLGQILHADLDVSDLHAAPIGRKTIRTTVRHVDELLRHAKGPGVIPFIAGEAARGRRTFVIVPLVQDDETATATSVEVAAAMLRSSWDEAVALAGRPGHAARHRDRPRPDEGRRPRRAHGALPRRRDQRPRRHDRAGGRRGRAGGHGHADPRRGPLRRGAAPPAPRPRRARRGPGLLHPGLVALSATRYPGSRWTDEQRLVKARLDAVAQHTDGFVLAELDFELRREGEMLGLQQSGLPPLRVASLAVPRHRELSLEARAPGRATRRRGRAGLPPGLEGPRGRADARLAQARRRRRRAQRGRARCLTRVASSPGTAKGVVLRGPGEGTRALSDRVKQALFATLESELEDVWPVPVLDLFAGQRRGRDRGAQPGRAARRLRGAQRRRGARDRREPPPRASRRRRDRPRRRAALPRTPRRGGRGPVRRLRRRGDRPALRRHGSSGGRARAARRPAARLAAR